MKIDKFNENSSEPISWDVDSINSIIKNLESRMAEAEVEQETSAFPEGEEQEMKSLQDQIWLLRDMTRDSWYMKHFYKK